MPDPESGLPNDSDRDADGGRPALRRAARLVPRRPANPLRAKPTAQGPSTMMILEGRDGRPHLHDVGLGDSPRFSPDDRTVAFALYPGESSDEPEGVWLMNADGTNRRRLCELAAPFWSPDGTQILLNGLLAHDLEDLRLRDKTDHPDRRPGTVDLLVAAVGCAGPDRGLHRRRDSAGHHRHPGHQPTCGSEGGTKALESGRSSAVFARWPVLTSPSGDLYFIGEERDRRTLSRPGSTPPGRSRLSAARSWRSEAERPLLVSRPSVSGLRLRLVRPGPVRGCCRIGPTTVRRRGQPHGSVTSS